VFGVELRNDDFNNASARGTARSSAMTTSDAPRRPGNKSLENIVRTDERYGHDEVWLGPRGRDYGSRLEHPRPYQIANLYPDQNSSYWIGTLKLPRGSTLILRGEFPHSRYCQFALYRPDPLGNYTATGELLVDYQIKADKGSINPFKPGANRRSERRSYAVRIVAQDAPARPKDRKPNTMYAGKAGEMQMVYRIYLPDAGRDGSGDVGLPEYEVKLANGKRLSAEQVRKKLNRPLSKGIPPGMSVEKWRALCNGPDSDPALKPETTPARPQPVVERYFSNEYNLIGVFKRPEERAKIPVKVATGFGGDPLTLFMFAWVSRKFGPVLVMRGKMPKFPDTFQGKDGKGLAKMTDWECRYWSVIMSEAPPSGMGNDALTDMQVPLDKDRNYTIVVCREEDRPANATEENGVAWLDWGTRGEGINDPSNRTDFGFLVFRFMCNNPRWKHNPDTITVPGSEYKVMGAYAPRFEYTDKATFERAGADIGSELPCLVCPFATDIVRSLVRPGDQMIANGSEALAQGFERLRQTLVSRAAHPGLAAGAAERLQGKISELRSVISAARQGPGLGNQLPCLICPFSTDLLRALIQPGNQVVASGVQLLSGELARLRRSPGTPADPALRMPEVVGQLQARVSQLESVLSQVGGTPLARRGGNRPRRGAE
jgi:hypothetical protein